MTYAMMTKTTKLMPLKRHRRSQNARVVFTLVDEAVAVVDALMTISVTRGQRNERLPFFDDIGGELRSVARADVLRTVDGACRDEQKAETRPRGVPPTQPGSRFAPPGALAIRTTARPGDHSICVGSNMEAGSTHRY